MAKRKQYQKFLPAVAVAILAIALLLTARPDEPNREQPSGTKPTQTAAPTSTTVRLPEAQMPIVLDGKLEIENLFPYDGINPDCGNQEGKNVAAIVLKNGSDTYLAEATITVTLTDGTQVHFRVTDLPAGRSAMVFSMENRTMQENVAISGAVSHATFCDEGVFPEQLSVSVDGMTVSVTNDSETDDYKVVIYCRSPIGEEYFGGVTYKYTIDDLDAGATATVLAEDCMMGTAEVVRVEIME